MESKDADAVARVFSVALVALAIWLIGSAFNGQPRPLGLDAPSTEFSAARADQTLARLLGPEVPHPVSTAANRAVRDRIRAEFAMLGVPTSIYRGVGCEGRANYGFYFCGTTEDILADVAPGEGKAIVLMAHYDSVPAGPGASDDQSGVATVLETVRALKSRGMKTRHPILALITDGEEAGLLGANSFLNNPALKARVGAVINVEARGNQGQSALFQTSPGDGALIDLYARNVPEYATSSLFAVIFKFLPNDTDLTLFINQGFTSFNFAFVGNIAHYHTALDRRENLSLSTLQMHGDSMLGVASGLMQTDFASLKGGDDVYLTLLGQLVPRLPASWALPLAVLTFVLLLLAVFLSRTRRREWGSWAAAAAAPIVVIVASAALGWLLHAIASLVSGQSDPSYAYPVFLRIALSIGVAAMVILASRFADTRKLALSGWLWLSGLGVVTAALLPGLSPYFLFPALVGSVLVLAQSRLAEAWTGTNGLTALVLAALLPLVIWFSLSATGESVQGLAVHPLFTVPLAFGAITLLPILASCSIGRKVWVALTSVLVAVAVAVAVIAGLQPAYSEIAPQRLSISFVDDHVARRTVWSIDARGTLPKAFRSVANFSAQPQRISPMSFQPSYVAPAGSSRFAPPTATVTSKPLGAGRRIALAWRGSPETNELLIAIPKEAGLVKITFGDKTFVPAKDSLNPWGTIFGCVTSDCRDGSVVLDFAARQPVNIVVGEQRFGLPPDGSRLEGVRPATTVASQSGDTTIVLGKVSVP
jgi:hypothetical protein